jgi:hypothetical protein
LIHIEQGQLLCRLDAIQIALLNIIGVWFVIFASGKNRQSQH